MAFTVVAGEVSPLMISGRSDRQHRTPRRAAGRFSVDLGPAAAKKKEVRAVEHAVKSTPESVRGNTFLRRIRKTPGPARCRRSQGIGLSS